MPFTSCGISGNRAIICPLDQRRKRTFVLVFFMGGLGVICSRLAVHGEKRVAVVAGLPDHDNQLPKSRRLDLPRMPARAMDKQRSLACVVSAPCANRKGIRVVGSGHVRILVTDVRHGENLRGPGLRDGQRG
jgi:hypothetical protein